MKKLILFIGIALLSVSCVREFSDNHWRWAVKNSTEQTLMLKVNNCQESDYDTYSISPNGYEFLFYKVTNQRNELHFYDYFDEIVGLCGSNVYWQILSEEGIVLKTWDYSDRSFPEQRFFKESSWSFEQWFKSGSGQEHLWIFEILPEDIDPK